MEPRASTPPRIPGFWGHFLALACGHFHTQNPEFCGRTDLVQSSTLLLLFLQWYWISKHEPEMADTAAVEQAELEKEPVDTEKTIPDQSGSGDGKEPEDEHDSEYTEEEGSGPPSPTPIEPKAAIEMTKLGEEKAPLTSRVASSSMSAAERSSSKSSGETGDDPLSTPVAPRSSMPRTPLSAAAAAEQLQDLGKNVKSFLTPFAAKLGLEEEPSVEEPEGKQRSQFKLTSLAKPMGMGTCHWSGNKSIYGHDANDAAYHKSCKEAFLATLKNKVVLLDISESFGDAEHLLAAHIKEIDSDVKKARKKQALYRITLSKPFGLRFAKVEDRLTVTGIATGKTADVHNMREKKNKSNKVIQPDDVLVGIGPSVISEEEETAPRDSAGPRDSVGPRGTSTKGWDTMQLAEFVSAQSASQFQLTFRRKVAAGSSRPWRGVLVANKFETQAFRIMSSALKEQCRVSLLRCGLKYFDLYQVHYVSSAKSVESWAPAMAELQKQGLIRGIGVSHFNVEQIKRFHAALEKTGLPLVSAQVEFSLLNRKAETSGLISTCKELGVAVLAHSPLAQGRLAGRTNLPGSRPYGSFATEEEVARVLEVLQKWAGTLQKTPAQVALRWVVQKGCIPLTGMSTIEQAAENCAGPDMPALPDEAMAELDQVAIDRDKNDVPLKKKFGYSGRRASSGASPKQPARSTKQAEGDDTEASSS
eukprot:g33258.t1